MTEQLELQKLHELYERWQQSTSEEYSINMFFYWIENELEELERE